MGFTGESLRIAGQKAVIPALVLSWLGLARGGEAPPVGAGISDSTVVLTGDINQAMLDRFNRALRERHVTTVMISSAGGDEFISMQIAATMQARGMDVVVRGWCLSRCAQYVFIAGHTRVVEDQSMVSFGSSATGLAALVDAVGDNAPREFRQSTAWRDFAVAEQRLYQQAGIAQSFLLDVELAMQPTCILFKHREGKLKGFNLSTRYQQWVPTRKYLDEAGVAIDGYWPESRRQMTRIANRLTATTSRTELGDMTRFGDEGQLQRWTNARSELKTLSRCALEEDEGPPLADGTSAGD